MSPSTVTVIGCWLIALATGATVFGLAARRVSSSSARGEILRWSTMLFATLLSYFIGIFLIEGGAHWFATLPALLAVYIALDSIHRITSAPIALQASDGQFSHASRSLDEPSVATDAASSARRKG